MKNKMFVCLGIFLSLSLSRFIPHPPNFTSLLALSFYVPAILGLRYLPILLISFAITDFIIGYHSGTFFTWGSVFMIGIMANYLSRNLVTRLSGALLGAFIFYLVTNFGVWLSGMYEYSIIGVMNCYTLALPFFAYSVISTLVFSVIIEIFLKAYQYKILKPQ
tara:strand:+ start:2956 stop:3444 length:489 start_codon:yes stop_codon:yes gene_type:complete